MVQKSYLHTALIVIVAGLLLIAVFIRVFFPPYYNMARLVPFTHMTEYQLIAAFNEDPVDAQSQYAQKVILLEGRIIAEEGDELIMGTGLRTIRISLKKSRFKTLPGFEIGQRMVLKGICMGIDLNEIIVSYGLILSVRE